MKNNNNPAIKKYFFTVALFFFFAVVLIVGQNLIYKQSETAIKKAATVVLKAWSSTAPEIGDKVNVKTKGLSYTWTFNTILKGKKNGLIFITALTGNSGPYTGVFIYSPQNGINFCGLAGISGINSTPEKYGISVRILNARMDKLALIASEYGALK